MLGLFLTNYDRAITCRIFKKDLQLPDVKPKDHEWNH
ncbi:unnamed protein product [Prunus armeniaca]